MSIHYFFAYLVTWSVIALTPGPAFVFAMAQATRHGLRSGFAGMSGIELGNSLLFVFVSLGLGTLLSRSATAFIVIRIIGGIYLFYMGVSVIRFTLHPAAADLEKPPDHPPGHRWLLLQGTLVQLTNPKALLFVSALLPQFIDIHRSISTRLWILAFTTIAVDSIVLSSYVILAHRGIRSLRNSSSSLWFERIFGFVLVSLGSLILFYRR